MGWRIGVDIGGTFTDVALIDEESGSIGIAKVPTTTQDITEGVTSGLREGLARYDIPPAAVSLLSHATTVVTNTLLQKNGAKTGVRDDTRVPRRARTAPILPNRRL